MSNASQWITPAVAAMTAYPVQPMPQDALRLSDMECPRDIDPKLRSMWLEKITQVSLNRYPRPGNDTIEENLRKLFAIPKELPILFGNGSDELIQIILTAIAAPNRTVLAPAPTFVMYQLVTQMLGMNYVAVDVVKPDFTLDINAMLAAIAQHHPAVIFLADPNNPTGNALAPDAVEAIIKAAPGLVVLDEAYFAFSPSSHALDMLKYDNVVVIRTLSKVGYAGLRFGYAFGHPEWMNALAKVKPPYNVNVLTRASVDFALNHPDFIFQQTKMICDERSRMSATYQALEGVKVWPSAANFLLIRVGNATKVYQKLVARHIWIKNLHGVHPLLNNCLRITISNRDDNDRCYAAIKAILEDHHAA